MFNWLKKKWVQLVVFPYQRRQVRNGVTALLIVDERMKALGWKRQRRRQVFRQLVRQPAHFSFIYDLLYQERNVKGDTHGTQ